MIQADMGWSHLVCAVRMRQHDRLLPVPPLEALHGRAAQGRVVVLPIAGHDAAACDSGHSGVLRVLRPCELPGVGVSAFMALCMFSLAKWGCMMLVVTGECALGLAIVCHL